MEDWKTELYAQFNQTVSAKNFPCLFAKQSQSNGTQKLSFYDESTESYNSLISDMIDYTETIKNVDIKKRLFTPMLVFFKPRAFYSLEEYQRLAWETIQRFHYSDVSDWPENVPKDPNNYLWSFCFNGVQLFINISTPLNKFHRSRNLGAGMVFVINPRENFDFVAGNNASGQKIRDNIRARCEVYDGIPASPALGFYADESNLEWKQYHASEAGGLDITECPFHVKK